MPPSSTPFRNSFFLFLISSLLLAASARSGGSRILSVDPLFLRLPILVLRISKSPVSTDDNRWEGG